MTARDELVAILDAVDFNHDSGSGDFASNEEYADAILANWTPQTVTAEQVASIKAEALEDAAQGFDQPDGDTHITYEFVRDRLNGQAARLREKGAKP